MQQLRETSVKWANAHGQKEYLEEFKKSKLAILMKGSEVGGFSTAAAQEREARAHPDYIALLEGLKVATIAAETLRWELRLAEASIEIWRTKQANARAERKGYGA